MPKIDLDAVKPRTGALYPEPHASRMGRRSFQALGDAAGLSQFGVNLVTMQPGASSSLRHWHSREDEFVRVVSDELMLVQNGSETVLRAGDAAGFKAGDPNGHDLQNRSAEPAGFLAVGTRVADDICHYSDVDLIYKGAEGRFTRRDGTFVKNRPRKGTDP